MTEGFEQVEVELGAEVPGGFELKVVGRDHRAAADCRELMGYTEAPLVTIRDESADYYTALGLAFQFEGLGARVDTRDARVYAPKKTMAEALLRRITFVYAQSGQPS